MIFRQSRVIAGCLILGVLSIPILLLPIILIDSGVIQLAVMTCSVLALVSILIYFAYGRLIITSSHECLQFKWKNKLLFNYRDIPDIELKSIRRLIVDLDILCPYGHNLRKLVLADSEVRIEHMRPNKRYKNEAREFIEYLAQAIPNTEIATSWDVFNEKGYLKWLLVVNTIVLGGVVSILAYGLITRGIDGVPPYSFLMLLSLVPQMYLYQLHMKKKVKTSANNL